jgi:Family of unknown function (DUF5989)
MKSQTLTTRAGTMAELVAFLWRRKLWWIIPLIALLVLVLLVVILAQSSAVVQWMYPLIVRF